MKCEEARSLLDLHLDAELPQELGMKLDRHLLRCSQCAGELRSLEQTRSLLIEAVSREESTPGYRERAGARLQDALAEHLRADSSSDVGRQWTLPFLASEP